MNLTERNAKIREYQEQQMKILDAKGADYTGGQASEDGNANFKEVARRLSGAPMNEMTVWAVYFLKHVMAIETFVKVGRVESEGMEGRFDDLANYANIGRTIFEESHTFQTFAVLPNAKIVEEAYAEGVQPARGFAGCFTHVSDVGFESSAACNMPYTPPSTVDNGCRHEYTLYVPGGTRVCNLCGKVDKVESCGPQEL